MYIFLFLFFLLWRIVNLSRLVTVFNTGCPQLCASTCFPVFHLDLGAPPPVLYFQPDNKCGRRPCKQTLETYTCRLHHGRNSVLPSYHYHCALFSAFFSKWCSHNRVQCIHTLDDVVIQRRRLSLLLAHQKYAQYDRVHGLWHWCLHTSR